MAHKLQGLCVNAEVLVLGMIDNNVYLIGDGERLVVVDPSCDAKRILKALDGRSVDAILITHGHWDHIGAAAALREATGAPVIASAVDAPAVTGERPFGSLVRFSDFCPVDRMVEGGDVVEVGSMKWQVVATPGHTMGSVCFYLPATGDQQGNPVLASGDTLFAGTCGRTDFEESDPAAMRASLKRLMQLPDSTVVLPGHNNLTSIARERPWIDRLPS